MGRQPALLITVVYAALMMLSQFGVGGIDEELAAGVQVLLTAIATAITAVKVRPVAPTVFTGVIVAGCALLTRFGFHLDEAQIAGITAFVAATVTAVFAWPNQTPRSSPAPGFDR